MNEFGANRKQARKLKEESHATLLGYALKEIIDRQRHLNARSELYRRKFHFSSDDNNELGPDPGDEITADRQRRLEARERIAGMPPLEAPTEHVDPFEDDELGTGSMYSDD